MEGSQPLFQRCVKGCINSTGGEHCIAKQSGGKGEAHFYDIYFIICGH